MDWSNYSDAANREANKMYDDIQVNKWKVADDKLVPEGTSILQEKARYVNSDRGSNKYNITQTIAETFGIFCIYEYKCAANGQFIKNYVDENGREMTGRTAVFYNRAIKTDNPFTLDYQKNLQSISRTCDSTEIYTKLFVDSIQSDIMTDGYVTIANTEANPLMDEFILNFDYLYSKGSITEYQKNFIDEYSVEIHRINETLRNCGELINSLTVEINDKEAEKAGAEKSISAIQEELTHYQTLRDNDVTNTPVVKDGSNSYSVVFTKDKNISTPYYRADIRLEGVLSGSIQGYEDYEYKNQIFSFEHLISSQDFKMVTETDENMYVVLDEDGYAIGLYTGHADWFETENTENSYSLGNNRIVYLALQYSPHNKYVDVCERFERMIVKKEKTITTCNSAIESKQVELDALIAQQTELLAEKSLLNQKLERIMGPALREGHWSADEYEDIGRKTETTIKAGIDPVDGVSLVFDAELFEGEEKGYYYTSAENVADDTRTYYDYIDISSYVTAWKDKNPEDLVIHLIQPEFKYTVPKSQVNGLAAGSYFISYNSIKYYFTLPQTLTAENVLRLDIFGTTLSLQMSTNNEASWTDIDFEDYDKEKDYANLTNAFENLNKYLGVYKIYPNAGFIYSFGMLGGSTEVTPMLLLNSSEINYSIYKQIGYSFGDGPLEASTLSKVNKSFTICHPRIIIAKNNVNYNDDLLTITEETKEPLTKFEDYSVLLRKGWPCFTLKVTENTTPYALLNNNYTITYRISQANEMLYRDALEVARENSRPRFSYEVSVAQLPDTVESYELGQLGYINDSALGVKAAKGYISSITLVLDSPKDDEIQIQNYKTKFEDLFATITASSEAMKSNQHSYDITASIVNPAGGIEGSILQESMDNNKIELTYSNTKVHIDDTDGITLTNTEPYSNGVYGQVVMRGGGIYLSNQVDSNYERIWTTGITPNGINASTITTGQLDANLVRIFAGNNLAFQWNSEGLYAYKRDEETNEYLPNTYVKYSDKGLQYLDNGFVAVDLGWNGLEINTQEGALSLTGKDGLMLYEGSKNTHATNHVVKLGRFDAEDGNYSYGMRLYKKTEETDEDGCHYYTETLTTTNNGQLWLKDYLVIGSDKIIDSNDALGAGISGVNNEVIDDSVRFWAGSTFVNRAEAPFRVLHDGTTIATKILVGKDSQIADGLITTKAIAAEAITADLIKSDAITADKIAANAITTDKIATDFDLEIGAGRSINITTDGIFTVASDNFTITEEGDVFLTGEITAESGSIGGWTISETSLHSGSDTNYVALSSDSTSNYRIWAGDTIAEKAPFGVEKDGTVTLTKIRALGEPDSNGNQSEKIISLYSQPLWAIWENYYNRVTGFTAEQATDGTVTLTITRQSAEDLTVNFKKAADGELWAISGGVGAPEFTVYYGERSSTNILASMPFTLQINRANGVDYTDAYVSASGYGNLGIGYVYNAGYTNATAYELRENDYEDGYYTIDVVQNDREVVPLSFSGQSAYEDGYTTGTNSVTISGSWDGAGTYTAETSTGKPTSTTIGIWGNSGTSDSFTVSAGESGSRVAQKTANGTLSISSNTATGIASVTIEGVTVAQKSVGEVFEAGQAKEATSLNIEPSADKTLDYGESVTIKATTTNNSVGKSVIITAPVDNYQNGYDAAKAAATIKYTGTEQARIIQAGSTSVTIVNASGIMVTGTFVNGGQIKTYNTGAYISYE